NKMNTYEAIKQNPVLPSRVKNQLLGAVAKQGKNKGYLLSNAPDQRTRPGDWLAWQVLISNLAPARTSVWGLIMSNTKEKYSELDDLVQNAGLVFALNTCEPAYRWNIWAHRYDRDKGQEELQRLYRQYREKQAVKAKTA
ncbi:MAG: hypothetical protein KJO69_07590, partial [Gammaproteobacteria bacterium]|nr:hypothetical protein [Gammaproteobacteria bacterium]